MIGIDLEVCASTEPPTTLNVMKFQVATVNRYKLIFAEIFQSFHKIKDDLHIFIWHDYTCRNADRMVALD